MNTEINLLIDTDNVTCPPLECYSAGDLVMLQLDDGLENKSADASGFLEAEIVSAAPFSQLGAGGKWNYRFTIDDSELNEGESLDAEHISGVCCLECDSKAILAKLKSRSLMNYTTEAFRIFEDDVALTNGDVRLFRRHANILLHAVEVACQKHDAGGYLYAYEPGDVVCSVITSPAQLNSPWSVLMNPSGSPVRATLLPSSSTPLTARLELPVPIQIAGGSNVGLNINAPDPEAHFGLEAHFDFEILTP